MTHSPGAGFPGRRAAWAGGWCRRAECPCPGSCRCCDTSWSSSSRTCSRDRCCPRFHYWRGCRCGASPSTAFLRYPFDQLYRELTKPSRLEIPAMPSAHRCRGHRRDLTNRLDHRGTAVRPARLCPHPRRPTPRWPPNFETPSNQGAIRHGLPPHIPCGPSARKFLLPHNDSQEFRNTSFDPQKARTLTERHSNIPLVIIHSRDQQADITVPIMISPWHDILPGLPHRVRNIKNFRI